MMSTSSSVSATGLARALFPEGSSLSGPFSLIVTRLPLSVASEGLFFKAILLSASSAGEGS
jgi:hypothetical protein